MAHKFVIRKSDKSGEYRAYFEYNSEKIFWTEGYSSKSAAQNARVGGYAHPTNFPPAWRWADRATPSRSVSARLRTPCTPP